MIDGTFNTELDTPLGRKKGTAEIHSEGDTFYADIHAPLMGKQRVEGKVDGDSFTAEGTFKLKLLGKVDYSMRGEVDGDELRVALDTSKGKFDLTGKRA